MKKVGKKLFAKLKIKSEKKLLSLILIKKANNFTTQILLLIMKVDFRVQIMKNSFWFI